MKGAPASRRKLVIRSTFTADPIETMLGGWLQWTGSAPELTITPPHRLFEPWGADAAEHRAVLIRLDDWTGRIDESIAELLGQLRSDAASTLVVVAPSTAVDPALEARALAQLRTGLAEVPRSHLVEPATLARMYPVERVHDAYAAVEARVPYTDELYASLAALIARRFISLTVARPKALVLDCDGTLWQGVIGEEGPSRVTFGEAHDQLQRLAREAAAAGILVFLCSKNEERDVLDIFEARPDMSLRREHLVDWRINWTSKSENLVDLARAHALSLDTFVFIDDNPIECAEMRSRCPEVTTIELPADLAERARFLGHLWIFDERPLTAEDLARTGFYQDQVSRTAVAKKSASVREFLDALELKIETRPATPEDAERINQLVHRTTQFTLGARPAPAAGQGSVTTVSDRFGEYGLVGVTRFQVDGPTLVVDTLSLSCRALARGVEHSMLGYLGRAAAEAGCTHLQLDCDETPRNAPMRRFLERLPAEVLPRTGGRRVVIETARAVALTFDPEAETSEPAEVPVSRGAAAIDPGIWQQIASLHDPVAMCARFASRPAVKPASIGAPATPRTPEEALVLGVWRDHFGHESVGLDDDFFALGGHSLLGLRVMSTLSSRVGRHLPISWLFEHPTVTALAAALAEHRETLLPIEAIAPRADVSPDSTFPLTDLQEAYLLGRNDHFELGGVGTHSYAECDYTDLDLARYERAWQRLIARHEMLRTIILPEGRQQVLADVPAFPVPVLDLRSNEPGERQARLDEERRTMHAQKLATDRWPLFDVRAVRIDERTTRVFTSFDGITVDLWSRRVLQHELDHFYGGGADLPPLALSFRDVVTAQAEEENSEGYRRAEAYWAERLDELPAAPRLPLAVAPSTIARPRFNRRQWRIAAEVWQQLKARAASERLTESGVLLTAFGAVLARYSEAPRFTVNLTLLSRPRTHPDHEKIVGNFTSLSLLEMDFSGADQPFSARAGQIQSRLWKDMEHRQFNGIRVQRKRARRQDSLSSAMPIVFTSSLGLPELAERHLRGEPVFARSQTPQVWIDFQVQEVGGDLVATWDTVDELFPAGLLDGMLGAWGRLVEQLGSGATAWEATAIDTVDVAHAVKVNRTSARVPSGCLEDALERQARDRPDQPAVIAPDRTLTYGELEEEARRIARGLCARGIQRDRPVGVLLRRGWQQMAAVFGVLLAGGAYLPLDPELPPERLSALIQHAGVDIVITGMGVENRCPAGVRSLLIGEPVSQEPMRVPRSSPTDLAYIIYTSGSTGNPKGVMIDHRGALNTIADINARFDVTSKDRVLALSSLSFDLSVWDIFGTTLAGAALVVPPPWSRPDPMAWEELIRRHKVTVWNSVPAMMQLFVETCRGTVPELRLVMLSGDWIPLALPDRVRTVAPRSSVISLGGATEASIWSIFHPIESVKPEWQSIPYGRPLANQTIWVLDERMQPCPPWVTGRLYIGGIGVALGYWRDPERTAAQFVNHPVTGEHLYHTGDLGRYFPDGTVEFLGRQDLQVKIRGHRIELGEIESALGAHPQVKAVAVTAIGDARQLDGLVAHIETKGPADPDELRRWLGTRLPVYMVPNEIRVHEHLPLSTNGKVDRKRLKELTAAPMPRPAVTAVVAGSDGLELEICRAFAKVLGVPVVEPGDDFFDLGGHSLLMLELTRDLGTRLSLEIPMVVIFQNPTPRALASAVRGRGFSSPLDHLVPFQTVGTMPPFFWMHGLNGSLLHDVVRHIGPPQPFYGLQPQGLDGVTPPLESLPEMAANYINAMRMVQPEGPYHVGGYCFGGVVAFEVAQQLIRAGQRVGLLVIIDIPVSELRPLQKRSLAARVTGLTCDVGRGVWNLLKRRSLGMDSLGKKIGPLVYRLLTSLGFSVEKWPAPLRDRLLSAVVTDIENDGTWTPLQRRLAAANTLASMNYVPEVFPGPITLIRCEAPRSTWTTEEPTWGWRDLAAGEVTVYRLPGSHSHIIHGDNARRVAAQIELSMQEAAPPPREAIVSQEQPIRESTATSRGPAREMRPDTISNEVIPMAVPQAQGTVETPMAKSTVLSIREGKRAAFSGPTDLVRMVQLTATRHPLRTAVIDGDVEVPYAQLVREAWGLSAYLGARGVGRNDRVGLLSQPCAASARAILGILGCGAAYVPLSPDAPDERLRTMAQDADLACVLAPPEYEQMARSFGVAVHPLEPAGLEPNDTPLRMPDPEDLAYIMYTSGSTGKPKGVSIRHRSVINLVESFAPTLGATAEDRWLSVTGLTFDISVMDHFLPWSLGAAVIVLPRSVVRDGGSLAGAIERFRPTHMQATPSGWRLLIEAGWTGRPELLAITGGEALTPRLARELQSRCRALWNLYGPTETTVWSSAMQVPENATSISLGSPIANTSLLVLDPETLAPVMCGEDGELCIGGLGLSAGYLGRPELTAEKFIANPVEGQTDPSVYRTGDRVRMSEDGSIEYLGRTDFQVKLRGFRIELGEIESVLGSNPSVRQAVVVLREHERTPTLVAYLTGDTVPDAALREYLAARLPKVMIPGHFQWVERFALNANGKIDRQALPAVAVTVESDQREPLDPVLAAGRRILGRPIGLADDLFDWGLDSGGAARLARALEPIFGRSLVVDTIFQARTLGRIKAAARAEAVRSILVPLEKGPEGNHQPVVLLHTLTGSLPRDLARALGEHRPVLGIRSLLDEEWGDEEPLTRLSQLASRAVDALEQLPLEGPLHLIGFSFGGILAFEIARQWAERGHRPGMLTLLDTDIQKLVPAAGRRWLHTLAGVAGELALRTRNVWPRWMSELTLYRRLLRHGERRRGRNGVEPLSDAHVDAVLRDIPGFADLPDVNRRMARRHARLEHGYRPSKYDGKILLLRRLQTNPLEARGLGWEKLASNLVIEYLPTTDHEVLYDRNYPVIAQRLQHHLVLELPARATEGDVETGAAGARAAVSATSR